MLARMSGVDGLMAALLYGTDMCLMECVRRRVKDVDFERSEILIRNGKARRTKGPCGPGWSSTHCRCI